MTFIDIWERLRGYNRWPEAAARIESADMETMPHTGRGGNVTYTYASSDVLVWTDARGERQFANFRIPDDSPLYQLVGGETVSIRYDPNRPDRFYWRALLQSRMETTARRVFWGLLILAALFLFGWLRVKTH